MVRSRPDGTGRQRDNSPHYPYEGDGRPWRRMGGSPRHGRSADVVASRVTGPGRLLAKEAADPSTLAHQFGRKSFRCIAHNRLIEQLPKVPDVVGL